LEGTLLMVVDAKVGSVQRRVREAWHALKWMAQALFVTCALADGVHSSEDSNLIRLRNGTTFSSPSSRLKLTVRCHFDATGQARHSRCLQ
jgi:hypothetical protein